MFGKLMVKVHFSILIKKNFFIWNGFEWKSNHGLHLTLLTQHIIYMHYLMKTTTKKTLNLFVGLWYRRTVIPFVEEHFYVNGALVYGTQFQRCFSTNPWTTGIDLKCKYIKDNRLNEHRVVNLESMVSGHWTILPEYVIIIELPISTLTSLHKWSWLNLR